MNLWNRIKNAVTGNKKSGKKDKEKKKKKSEETVSSAARKPEPKKEVSQTAVKRREILDAARNDKAMSRLESNRLKLGQGTKIGTNGVTKSAPDKTSKTMRLGGTTSGEREKVRRKLVENNPKAAGFIGGAASGALLDAPELLGSLKSDKGYEHYKKNRNKTAETVGNIAGSFATFGATAGATDALGAKAVKKVAPKAAEKLAEKKFIQKSAQKTAEKAVKKGVVKEATPELVKEIGKKRAQKVVNAIGNDVVQNLTTGAIYDINRASSENEVGSKEWWKDLGTSAAINAAITGGVAGVAMKTGGKQLAKEAAETFKGKTALKALKSGADEAADAAEDIARQTVKSTVNNAVENEARAAEIPKSAVKNSDEITEDVVKNLDDERGLATTASGERARTGERTEFHRGNEETAREQARNRRAEGSTGTATQETFDRDFEAFTRKASETRAKIDELKGRLRVAASEEERASISQQISALNDEMKREYRAASLRYHPDRGGSDDWMREFNNTYDEYKRGSIKSRSFRGAQSSTRPRTAASAAGGNGGNTPPPRRNMYSGAGNFGKPKGTVRQGKTTRVVNNPEDIVHRTKQMPTRREKAVALKNKVQRELFDSLHTFEKEARAKAKTDHDGMLKDFGAIDALRRFKGKAQNSIYKKQMNWAEKEVGKGLAEIYDGMDDATETAFDTYLLLKHAPDRINEGTSIFKNIKLATGESLDDPAVCAREADRILAEHPEFASKADDIYAYTRNELQNRVDAGLLSQETADDWIKRHPFYVPTHRDGFSEVGGIKGRTVGAEGEKAAKGSDLDIRSIKEQLAEATTRNWRDMTMNNLFRRMFGDKVGEQLALETDGGLEMVLGNTITLKKSAEGGKYYARVWENGDFKNVEIDKDFYDDLADLYKNGRLGIGLIDGATDVVLGWSSVWKNLVTEWSPIFMVKNALRDFPEAVINSRNRKEFMRNIFPALKDLASGGEYSQALQRAGVSQSTIIGFDKDLNTLSKRGFISKLNQMTEMYPRLVEYMAAIKNAGKTIETADKELLDQAAAQAADVTVNFQRNGSVGKALNRGLVPFFNPSLQGLSKFTRNFTEAEDAKAVLKLCLMGTALGAGPSTISQFVNRDNPNYQQISSRDRANNYIIAWPPGDRETDTFVKIPKSRFAAVYGLPLVNAFSDNKMEYADMIKVGKDDIGVVDPSTSYIGSAVATATATPEGKTWYGSPIVPQALQKAAPSEQYDANTSYLGRALGKATENLPESMQISPKKADYIIDSTTGILGDVALPALTPSRQGGGKSIPEKVGYALGNVPKRAFTIDSVSQNDLSTRFYNQMESAEHKKNGSKATDADSDEYNRMNAYSSEISKVNKAIRTLQGSTKKTKQLDIRELQKVRNELMQSGLDGKEAPNSQKTMDAVQKSVGTTYAIKNFGTTADQEAYNVYAKSTYGNLTAKETRQKMNADKEFYKGVQAIGKLKSDIEKKTGKSGITTVGRSVALAEMGASDNLFGAYEGTNKSRTERSNKMERARSYIENGGSTKEYVKIENARKSLGKLPDETKADEIKKLRKQLGDGKITEDEYYAKKKEVNANANASYKGLATSLALANAPSRAYELLDIKSDNAQKGINLAAIDFDARGYREAMKKADKDGNGYPKKQEIIDYINSTDIKDKATLFDAIYPYQTKYNPFGTPTNYTREQAAAVGKARGVEWIVDDTDELDVKDPEGTGASSGSGGGYYRRGYRRYRRYRRSGGSGKTYTPKYEKVKASTAIKANTKAPLPKPLPNAKSMAAAAYRNSNARGTSVKLEPPMLKVEQAKMKKYEV